MFNFLNKKALSHRVYLDTAASTPIDEEVLAVMTKTLKYSFGNPASIHHEGVEANNLFWQAKTKVASFLKALPEEIIFTSGGTESNNLALSGVATAYEKKYKKPGKIITLATEHSSILKPIERLAAEGWQTVVLPVDQEGRLAVTEFKKSLTTDTVLVSFSLANNEIGTLLDLREVMKIVRRHRKDHGTIFPYVHTDACQAPRFLDLNVLQLGVDLLTINGSKIYGPKGVGVLFVKKGVDLEPLLVGGGQQSGRRSGTINVPTIVAFAKALDICTTLRVAESQSLVDLRNYLKTELTKVVPTIIFHGDWEYRLPNNLNFTVPGLEAEFLVIALDAKGFAVSTGSACSNLYDSENHVLEALYGQNRPSESSIRVSLGRDTRKADLDKFVISLKLIIEKQQSVTKITDCENSKT